ncbi:MAG TPA: ABC transporter permease, partial [Planctomycetota bacterium]|nr:ABC transporter permease [Planctomycetota bacterium]
GRDVLSRMIHGGRISMSVGFVAVSIATILGILIGGLAGYYRGWVDIAISRFIELMICFPTFFLIITIIAFIEERSVFHIMLIMGLTGWTGVARLVRGEFLKLGGQDFVTAARAVGCSGRRVMFRHILPNALGPVLVSTAFGIAGAVLTESGLSYLGFGAPPPTPTWGEMISQGKQHIDEAWWLMVFPGLSIFLTVTVYNLAGDGLRDAMDPKMRK